MSKDRTEVAVTECGGELFVRVRVYDGENLVGETRLEGGNLENATGMAEGLVAIVEGGGDLRAMLPDPVPVGF